MTMSPEKVEMSVLEIKEKVSSEFSWDFKIPPRSRIRQNMAQVSGGGGFVFSDLKFTTGFLANVPHQLIFAIYANQVNAYFMLPTKHDNKKYDMTRIGKLELFSQNKVLSTKELRFSAEDNSQTPNPHTLFATVWMNTDGSWDDEVEMMRLTFCVEVQEMGETICYANEDISKKLKLGISPLELNASELFLSPELSDTMFVCGNCEFPAHRFLLACKSPVFKQMFQHEMKEVKEGKIVVNDMEPEILKELLRFLYCGEVNNMDEVCGDLFPVAEKYDLGVLKNLCELALLQNISKENALEMYMLGETYHGIVLMEKAVQMLKKYKSEVVPDSETFQEFTRRYPELMFQLYKI